MPASTPAAAIAATVVSVVALAGLMIAEAKDARVAKAVTKALAALGFVAVAVALAATDEAWTTALLVGLVLSLVGDLFLLSSARPYFLAGLFAFLAAHVAYVVAFASRGLDATGAVLAAPVLLAALVVIVRWLLPHVKGGMRGPVVAYIVVISTMALAAAATTAHHASWTIPIGATMFFVSDLAVARDRFVAPGFINRTWGLPLYFGGQLILAWSAWGA